MAGERVKLVVQERESRGTRPSRRLRRDGLIPGVLYGQGKPPHAICVPERELRRVLTGSGGLHAILDVVLDGQSTPHHAVLKEYQQDPIRGRLTHVDFHEVRLDRPIQASVVVQLVGEAAGTTEGGVLAQVTREVTVEALPMEIPEHVDLDVSGLGIGDSLRVADLPAIEGVTFVDDPETVLANVTLPTQVVEPEEVLEEEEAEEGAEAPAAEEASGGGSEAPAEPGGDAAGEPGTVPG
jgi:large subunit ribosomal protein L25